MHISDLHLGKIVNGYSMLEEQQYIIQQVIEKVNSEAVDTLVIAGDVYDRSIPPAAAISVFDNLLVAMQNTNTRVIIINGNHDSSERLNYASQVFKQNDIHFVSDSSKLYEVVEVDSIRFYCIGFKSLEQFNLLLDNKYDDYNQIYEHIFKTIDFDSKFTNILVDHSYIIGGQSETIQSDSERQITLGGSSFVATETYSNFDLVIAGHIHKHQFLKPNIYYSGSIYPYSFSEQNNKNGFYIYDINEKINANYYHFKLRKKYATIEGYIEDLEGPLATKSDDYLNIVLLDNGAINKPLERLRINYPNIMQVSRYAIQAEHLSGPTQLDKLDENQLFSDFYNQVYEQQLDDEQMSYLNKTIEIVKKEIDEAN